jgi:hypothetical protein
LRRREALPRHVTTDAASKLVPESARLKDIPGLRPAFRQVLIAQYL